MVIKYTSNYCLYFVQFVASEIWQPLTNVYLSDCSIPGIIQTLDILFHHVIIYEAVHKERYQKVVWIADFCNCSPKFW